MFWNGSWTYKPKRGVTALRLIWRAFERESTCWFHTSKGGDVAIADSKKPFLLLSKHQRNKILKTISLFVLYVSVKLGLSAWRDFKLKHSYRYHAHRCSHCCTWDWGGGGRRNCIIRKFKIYMLPKTLLGQQMTQKTLDESYRTVLRKMKCSCNIEVDRKYRNSVAVRSGSFWHPHTLEIIFHISL